MLSSITSNKSFVVGAVAGSAVLGAAYWLFGGEKATAAAPRKQEDLPSLSAAPLPAGVVVLTPEEIFSEGVAALTLAWSGNPSCPGARCEPWLNWCCGTALAKHDDPVRLKAIEWCMRFFLECGRRYGQTVLGTRDADGTLVAVVAVCQYPRGLPQGFEGFTQFLGALWRLWRAGLGFTGFTLKGFSTRFEASGNMVEPAHRHACPDRLPHLYVGPVGILPGHQGKGLLGPMMRTVNTWADALGMTIYLETSGKRNPRMYARYGYADAGGPTQLCGPIVMENSYVKGEEAQPAPPGLWSMVRRPGSSSSSSSSGGVVIYNTTHDNASAASATSGVWNESGTFYHPDGTPNGFTLRNTVAVVDEAGLPKAVPAGADVMLEKWEAGSEEPIHSHPGDDMTVVVEGRMSIQYFTRSNDGVLLKDGPRIYLNKGDVGYVMANRLHDAQYHAACKLVYVHSGKFGFAEPQTNKM